MSQLKKLSGLTTRMEISKARMFMTVYFFAQSKLVPNKIHVRFT